MGGSSGSVEATRVSSWSVIDIPNDLEIVADVEVSDVSGGPVIRLSIGEPEIVQLVLAPEAAAEVVCRLQYASMHCLGAVARGGVVRGV